MSDDHVAFSRPLAFVTSALDPSPNGDKFREYYQLANQLVSAADKTLLAEVARILAIDVAYFRMKYGATPIHHKTRALLRTEMITDEEVAQLADAMGYLVAVIATTAYEAEGSGDMELHH